MPSIAITNAKGGAGKTAITVTLATGLAILGKNVLLIDGDQQGHSTISLGLTKEPCFYDFLVRNLPWERACRPVPRSAYMQPDPGAVGELTLMPGNVETFNIPNSIQDPFVVKDRLDELNEIFDVILIDTGPTAGALNGIILLGIDAVLYPSPCERLAFDGLVESMHYRDRTTRIRAARKQPTPMINTLGIIPTFYRATTVEHKVNLDSLRDQVNELIWEPVPQRITWTEAVRAEKSIFAYAPQSDAAEDGWRLVKKLVEVLDAQPV